MTTKTTLPEIERIKFKDLTIDNLYSGRSEKEITENAKEKQKELEAAGGWNPAMPGQYFERDNEKFLLAGFSRVKASIMNGEDAGYFVKVDGDDIDHLLACETTNSVKTMTPLSRGARYSDLFDGVLADDFDGAIADRKNPAHWKRMPLTVQDIADRIGKTTAWVYKCIAIYKSPPEVSDMIESDKIAATVAEGARVLVDKHHNGSDAKCIAICKRAYAAAKADEKETATKKHFDEIKGEFIPEKKLVADGKEEPAKTGKKASSSAATGSDSPEKDDTAELPAGYSGEGAPEEQELFTHAAEVMEPESKKNTKLREAWKTILMEPSNLEETVLDEDTVDAVIEKLHAAMIAARDVF